MNIQITSRKFRAKPSLKDYVTKELKHLEKFHDDILDANVILSFTHLKDSIKTAEINIKVPGKTFSATNSSDDFRKSIKAAAEKLLRQLNSYKERRRKKVKV